MAKKPDQADHGEMNQEPDGHWVLNGSRWHTPKQGSPTECEINGCDRVLGAWRDHDPLDDIEADDTTEQETQAA